MTTKIVPLDQVLLSGKTLPTLTNVELVALKNTTKDPRDQELYNLIIQEYVRRLTEVPTSS